MKHEMQHELRTQLPELHNALQAYLSTDPDTATLDVTVATDGSEWSYQTGDNSYTGSAYLFPHWAIYTIDTSTDGADFALEVIEQLSELLHATSQI